ARLHRRNQHDRTRFARFPHRSCRFPCQQYGSHVVISERSQQVIIRGLVEGDTRRVSGKTDKTVEATVAHQGALNIVATNIRILNVTLYQINFATTLLQRLLSELFRSIAVATVAGDHASSITSQQDRGGTTQSAGAAGNQDSFVE